MSAESAGKRITTVSGQHGTLTMTTKPKPWNALRRRYGATVSIVRALDVDDDVRVLVIGDPNNGSYDWAIEKHGNVERYSDVGYGIADVALRDGLIAYYPKPPVDDSSTKPGLTLHCDGYTISAQGEPATASATPEQPCGGCGKPLLIENAWMEDGCPCNTPAGVNNLNLYRWRLLHELQQRQARESEARALDAERYRWLRDHSDANEGIPTIAMLGRDGLGVMHLIAVPAEDCDEVVDVAMRHQCGGDPQGGRNG